MIVENQNFWVISDTKSWKPEVSNKFQKNSIKSRFSVSGTPLLGHFSTKMSRFEKFSAAGENFLTKN